MAYLVLYLILEPVKRVLSALLYPAIYPLRRLLRNEKMLWPEYLYRTNFWPLWLFLDDSIFMEFNTDFAGRAKYYPAVIWRTGSDFLRSYWWSAIRNSCVNWNNYSALRLGLLLSETPRANPRNFYVTRTFGNGKRPYCEFWIAGRWNQVGWISCGRFEVDVMKDKR